MNCDQRYFKCRSRSNAICGMPAKNPIATYTEKKEKLNLMLWSLYSPVMFMLAFYLYMAANLIIDRQKTEISVLRSRGASRMQIMSVFLIESVHARRAGIGGGAHSSVFISRSCSALPAGFWSLFSAPRLRSL